MAEPALQCLHLQVILVDDVLEFVLSSKEVVVILVYSPDKQIIGHFTVVLRSWNLSSGINYSAEDVEQLELKHFLNIINKSYLLILLTQINNQ